MAIHVELPQHIEQAYLAASEAMGIPVDTLVSDVLAAHVPESSPQNGGHNGPELVDENGILVLRTGKPLDISVVERILTSVRCEREAAALGELR